MPKLIDLTQTKDLTTLMVDLSMLAVWHGCDAEARTLIAWLRHRTDDDTCVIWVDAFRCMCAQDFPNAERLLRELLQKDPKHASAKALLANVLAVTGQPGARELVNEVRSAEGPLEDGALELANRVQALGGMATPLPMTHLALVG